MNKKDALAKLKDLEADVAKLKKIIEGPEHSIEDVKSVKDACTILEEDYEVYKEKSAYDRLKLVIKAINYIANGNKIWKPDFLDSNKPKFINWFELKKAGWVLFGVYRSYTYTYCPVRLYFMERSSAEFANKQHLDLYNEFLNDI